MLDVFEVVDSPAKSPKCVSTQNGSVWQTGLSGFVGSGGSQGHRWLWWGRSFPVQVASQGVVVVARRSNEVKMRRKPKTRAKTETRLKSRILIDLIDVDYNQSWPMYI
jgi:hypothetical protein